LVACSDQRIHPHLVGKQRLQIIQLCATLVTYVFPLIGVALGVVFLGELLNWHLLVGGGMVVASIAVVNRKT